MPAAARCATPGRRRRPQKQTEQTPRPESTVRLAICARKKQAYRASPSCVVSTRLTNDWHNHHKNAICFLTVGDISASIPIIWHLAQFRRPHDAQETGAPAPRACREFNSCRGEETGL